MIARALGELFAAIRFLTIFPVGDRGGAGFGAVAFPIVGLLLGFAAVVLDRILGFAGSPLVDLAIVVFWMIASGAIHYDGLADACDGLGGRTLEDRLRLMADGSIGTFGVLALVVSFSTRLVSLVALASSGRTAALLVAPTLGRTALLVAAFDMPAARPDGLGASFVAALDRATLARAATIAVAVAFLAGGSLGVLATVVVLLAALGVRSLARRRLGGTTGDVIGATGEVTEALALAVFAAGARNL